jgi:hypothetical protein
MKKIFKYTLYLCPKTEVYMPRGAKVLTVQLQGETIQLWALVDESKDSELRIFNIYGTGHLMPDNPGKYIGTVQIDSLVWHIFDASL